MGLATLREKINDAKKSTEINDWEEIPGKTSRNILSSEKVYFRVRSSENNKISAPIFMISIGKAIAEMLDLKIGDRIKIKRSISAPHLFLIRKSEGGSSLKLYSHSTANVLNVQFRLDKASNSVKFPKDITKSCMFDFKSDGSLIIDISKMED